MAADQLRLGALKRAVLAAALCVATAIAQAAPAAQTADAPLRGATWAPGASASRSLRLDPVQARLSGHAGCNRISGSFDLDGERLVLGPLVSTAARCC